MKRQGGKKMGDGGEADCGAHLVSLTIILKGVGGGTG